MKNNKENLKEAIRELKTKTHRIERETGREMIEKLMNHKENNLNKGTLGDYPPEIPKSVTFNKTAVEALLQTPGCQALRIYYGINSSNQLIPILVGVNEEGENILEMPQSNEMDNSSPQMANAMAAPAPPISFLLDEGQINPPFTPEEEI